MAPAGSIRSKTIRPGYGRFAVMSQGKFVLTRFLRGSFCLLAVHAALRHEAAAQGSKADYTRATTFAQRTEDKVFRAKVDPAWLPGGTSFWYRVRTAPAVDGFVVVDCVAGTRTVADAPPVAVVPLAPRPVGEGRDRSRRTGDDTTLTFVNQSKDDVELFWIDERGGRQSYGRIRPGQERAQHTFAGHVWWVTDRIGTGLGVYEATSAPDRAVIDGSVPALAPVGPTAEKPVQGASPDKKWVAFIKDHDLHLREVATGREEALSKDGTDGDAYDADVSWAPDSSRVAAVRVRKGGTRTVYRIESSPKDQLQPKLHSASYLKPGDILPKPRLRLFDVASRKQTDVDDALYPEPFTESGDLDLRWAPDSHELYFTYNQRGHQIYRLVGVDPRTGVARTVAEDVAKTFVDWTGKTWRHWLDATGELLWMSERDGWCHLWLHDVKTGAVKGQVTRGAWVVRRVEHVDEARRQIWFMAGGVRPGQDPYYLHLCRVDFDGSNFIVLTEGDGTHKVEFSPDRRWFIDTRSRVDLAPVTELRRADDGRLVVELERGDAGALLAAGWTVPERFVAKGRDGTTDIHGIIVKPSRFDPAKRYPVIEEIYAGPHGAFVPKEFSRLNRQHALAELGFVVVQMDGMGTSQRSKAFQDVCWKNLADAGFPDRKPWIRAAAATRPWMDLSRVGIYGGSAGGQSSTRALLDHGDFYKVAVSDCGCHDNRMDKIWWNEQWLGWPVGDAYKRSSNVEDAHKLTGKLLLIVGELDTNVDPASTLQVVDALEKADKDFELLVMTGAEHGAAESPYGIRRRMDFFVRHLLGKEPRWE